MTACRVCLKGLSPDHQEGDVREGYKKSIFMSSLSVGQKYGELKDKRKWVLPPLAIKQEARQQAGVFKMARGSWRAFAILRFGWRAALTGVVLFISRGRNTDSAGLWCDRDVHRLGKPAR